MLRKIVAALPKPIRKRIRNLYRSLPFTHSYQRLHAFIIIFFNEYAPPINGHVPLMIDVGAQLGSWSTRFARAGWDVIGFEASPVNYKHYTKAIAGFDNITPVQMAVSDSDAEEISFYYNEHFIGVNSLRKNHKALYEKGGGQVAKVKTTRLDTYLGERAKQVTYLKLDIEGAELPAVKTFPFDKHLPIIVSLEYGGRAKAFDYEFDDIIDFFANYSYTAYISDFESSTSYDHRTKQQVEARLRFYGRLADYKEKPNWGELIFVRNDHTDQFKKMTRYFQVT